MKRRLHRVITILPAMFAAAFCAAAGKPNVLFIASDDLRNELGCYGDPLAKTPNLDRLAQRGVLFERAYAQQALCNPSRASLMTGRSPDTLQLWNLAKHFRDELPDVVTIPQNFRKSGYFAQDVGKIFHNWRTEIHGDPASWDVPAQMHFLNHHDDTPVVDGPLPPNLAKDPKCECRDVPDEAYYDGRVSKLALEAMRTCASERQPFFLAVGFWKPHNPFNAPKRYWDLYDRSAITMPEHPEWPKNAPRIAWHDSREILGKEGRTLSPASVLEIRHGYLAVISYLDAQVGKLLDELDRLKLSDNTIIVFWSDHGYHLGEQTLWAKTSNFELDARVPLMIAAPGIPGGRRTRSLAALMDIYPTLAELAGLSAPPGMAGKSLVPVLKDPMATVRESVLTQHPRPAYFEGASPEVMGYSLRTDRYRYTEWRTWTTGEVIARELYDHMADPDETRNAAGDAASDEAVKRCAEILETYHPLVHPGWRKGSGD